ncbi:MAG: hypothetical protein RR458_02985 [Clostridia bacterium]
MKINKEIITEYSKIHIDDKTSHNMIIDAEKLAFSYQIISIDEKRRENPLTFQGVDELDDYVQALVEL